MLTFEKTNKKIARIEGGERDGELIYLYNPDNKCCGKCSKDCQTSKKKCCNNCIEGKSRGGCGSCKGGKLRNRDIFDSITIKEGTIIPLPNENDEDADHYYIAGQTGAGKSSMVGNIIKEIPKGKKKDIFVFSTFDDDKALDELKPTRINIDEDMIDEPIQKEELQNSVVIFDDIDKIRPAKLAKACRDLRDDLLQNGRKMGIKCFTTSHQIMDYKSTRDCLNCTQKIVIFPQATSPHHISRFLKVYMGFDKNQINKVKNINTRSILFSTNFPRYMLWDKGCMIVNKMSDEDKKELSYKDLESDDELNISNEEQSDYDEEDDLSIIKKILQKKNTKTIKKKGKKIMKKTTKKKYKK